MYLCIIAREAVSRNLYDSPLSHFLLMMRPAVRLCLGVVATTAVLHVAATPTVVGRICRCVSSVGVMLHHN
jgi:hypothetical protein